MSRNVNPGSGIDAPFHVDQVHRLRFTESALDPSNATLREVLEQAGGKRHRVLAFVDSGVAAERAQRIGDKDVRERVVELGERGSGGGRRWTGEVAG